MASFSVASLSTDSVAWLEGFSFAPNVVGPSGSGSPGTATVVYVNSVIVGCPSLAAAQRAGTCYIYSIELSSSDQIGSGEGLVGTSASVVTGGAFGSGCYSASYSFENVALNPSAQYYAYFSDAKEVDVDSSSPYTGGTTFDEFMEDSGTSPQFQVNMGT